ncbi:probable G-protein coupled receptor No18 [Lytechinus pictus]|uniref:probable G-protein coupled receptor No18 n=1 Tax=Lytechinus pictus TaxID=7653 RepID=UPI0030BA1197
MDDDILNEGITSTTQTKTKVMNGSRNSDLFVFEDYNQRIATATILCIVFVVGSIGNTLVIIAVILSRKLRTSTNWFVVNLGCSDLLTCLSLPFHIVALLSRDGWPLAGWICAANSVVSLICVGASVMTLSLIAYNRWFLLTKIIGSFQKLYTTRNICLMVLSAWLYPALLVLVPHFAGLGRLGYSYEYKTCSQDTSLPNSDLYSLIAGAGGIIPVFIAIVVIYIRIYLFVTKQRKNMNQLKKAGIPESQNVQTEMSSSEVSSVAQSNLSPDNATKQSCSTLNMDISQTTEKGLDESSGDDKAIANEENFQKKSSPEIPRDLSKRSPEEPKVNQKRPRFFKPKASENKTQPRLNKYNVTVTKRLAIVVLAFFICLLPFGVSVVVPPSDPGIPWTGLMLSLNSCINPLIYARTMPDFRKVMLAIIRCRLKNIPDPIACLSRFR